MLEKRGARSTLAKTDEPKAQDNSIYEYETFHTEHLDAWF
jgi:hypothetical protein